MTFSWDQSAENTLQRRNDWYINYHGVALGRMDRRLLYDVLLSLQLRVWCAMAEEVEVVLTEPVGRITLDFWTAYFGLSGVSFTGAVDDTERYDPGRPRLLRRLGRAERGHDVAVTFGGGKDSSLAQQALLEQRRRRDVLLLHVVQHFWLNVRASRRVVWRSLLTIVAPNLLRHRNPVQVVSTNYMAVLRRSSAPTPHINLYVAGMLPALIQRGVHQVVFSRTAQGFRVTSDPDGALVFSNPSGRPERLAHLRRYYAHVLGWDLHSESTHRAITEFVSFGTILRRYPRTFASMVMCTRTRDRVRFCHDCPKCLEFALLGLAHGLVAADLDYDRLFTSPTVTTLVTRARQLQGRRAWHGAGPYVSEIGTKSHFSTWCHTLHLIDPHSARISLGPQAREHLVLLKKTWGQVPFPAVAQLAHSAVTAAGPLGREVAAAAATVYPVCAASGNASGGRDQILLVGDRPAGRDDAAVMPTPELDAWAMRWGLSDHGSPAPWRQATRCTQETPRAS